MHESSGVGVTVSSRTRKRRIRLLLYGILAAIAMLYALFPAAWILSASLDPLNSLATQRLIPRNPSLQNYTRLLNDATNPFLLWLANSLKVSTITSVLAVLVTAAGAYAFSRFRFRGRRGLLVVVLLVQIFPNMLAMLAIFLFIQQIGEFVPSLGLNTHGGLILVYLGGILGASTWLMKGYFDTIPRDLDEAAMIDGASHWQVFRRVILPLVRPMLVVVFVISFVSTYGDVVLAQVLLKDSAQFTLGVGLWLFIDGWYSVKWGLFAAGALIGALPIVVAYLLLQDLIVGGLTQGAVKGQ